MSPGGDCVSGAESFTFTIPATDAVNGRTGFGIKSIVTAGFVEQRGDRVYDS